MKCSIEELDFDQQKQLANNVQTHGYFFGTPKQMAEQSTLPGIASLIHTINNQDQIISRKRKDGRLVSHINSLGKDITTASNLNRISRTYGKGTDTTPESLDAARNMLAGTLFHDVLMTDAWGWVMKKLAETELERQDAGVSVGDFKSRDTYQLATIPGATIKALMEGGDGSAIDELFGLGAVRAQTIEYPGENTLLGHLMNQAALGRYSQTVDFKIAGKDRKASFTFQPEIMPDVAEYVRQTLVTAVTAFAKSKTAYKSNLTDEQRGIEDRKEGRDEVYSNLIIGTNVFAFSPQRNQGGFIDLMFISEDGKRSIVDDFKSKLVLAGEKFSAASPINQSNQYSHSRQVQVYMDAMRYYGTNPLMGQLLPVTMILNRSNLNLESGGVSEFSIGQFVHAGNATNLKAKGYQYFTVPFSSALAPQLEQQSIILSDYIEQTQERARETRATIASATVSDDPDVRNQAWNRVRASAQTLFDRRYQISKTHQDAFNQLTVNFNIAQYMNAAVDLDGQVSDLHSQIDGYIANILTPIRDSNEFTPQAFLSRMADSFMAYHDLIQDQLLEIKALKAVFNSKDKDIYINGLVKMTLSLDSASALKMDQTIAALLEIIPPQFYFGTNMSAKTAVQIYQESVKQGTEEQKKFLENVFKPVMSQYFDNITSKLEAAESNTQRIASDMIMSMIPQSYHEKKLNEREKRIVVRSMGFWEKNLTRPELIRNPLFEIMTKLRDINNQRAQRLYEDRIEEFDQVHNEFKKYLSDNKIKYDKGTDLLINKKTGMLHNRFTDEFNQLKVDAYQSGDIAWIAKHFKIKDPDAWRKEYAERFKAYDEALQREVEAYNEQIRKGVENPQVGITEEIRGLKLKSFEEAYNLLSESGLALANRSNLRYLEPQEFVHKDFATPMYAKIQESKALLDMYNQFITMAQEAKNVMGGRKAYLPDEFFPNVKAEMSEMITDGRATRGGMGKSFGFLMDLVGEEFRTAPIDETMGVYNEETFGRSAVPFSGVVPLVTHEGNIFAEGNEEALQKNAYYKSFDLNKVGHSFISSMFQFAQYKYTEPMIQALNQFAKSDQYVEELSNRGITAKTKTGQTRVTAPGQTTASGELLEKFTNYFWYGIRYKDLKDGKAADWVIQKGDPIAGKGAITVMSTLMALRNIWSRNVLGLAFVSGASAGLAGMTNTWINAMESRYFDAKTLKNSWEKYLKVVRNRQKRGMMRAVSLHFDSASVSTARYRAMKGARTSSKILSDWTLYGPLRTPDMVIADVITDAILNSYGLLKPETASAKYSTLARLEDLPEGSKSLAEMIEVDSNGKVTYDKKVITENQVGQIKEEIRRAIAETYGQLSEDTLMGAQLSIAGTLLTTFATWMPSLAEKRLGKAKVIDMGTPETSFVSIGRYRSIVNLLRGDKLKVNENNEVESPEDVTEEDVRQGLMEATKNILSNIYSTAEFLLTRAAFSRYTDENLKHMRTEFYRWKLGSPEEVERLGRPPGMSNEQYEEWLYQKWLDGEKKALKSAAIELYVLSGLFLLLSAARGDYDDDGKADYKNYWAGRMFVKALGKTHSELLFLLDPTQIERMIREPIPVTGMLSDIISLLDNTVDEVIMDQMGYAENSPYDKSPLFYYSSNWIFGFRQARRIFEPFEQDVEKGLD